LSDKLVDSINPLLQNIASRFTIMNWYEWTDYRISDSSIPNSLLDLEMFRKIQLTNIGYCLHLSIVAFKLLQLEELLVEIHKHSEVDGLNKTFFTGICFNLFTLCEYIYLS
jgi:hypothetical protein